MRNCLKSIVIAILFVTFSCGTTKTVANEENKKTVETFVGDWDIVTSTADAQLKSVMKITKNEDSTFTGIITSDQGIMPMENVKIESSDLSSSMKIQGMDFELKGKFTDNKFSGDFVGMGFSFPVSGDKIVN